MMNGTNTRLSPEQAALELAAWLSAEKSIRTAAQSGPGAGSVPKEVALGMDGLSLMQAMLRGELPYPSISQTLDFLVVEVAPGRAVFQGTPGPAHLNPMGGVHGGWYATLLDSALGCAVHTCMAPGQAYTTAELTVHLVKGITPAVKRVRAIGQVLHCGRQLATAEGKLVGPDGTLYAHATTSCLVMTAK